MSQTPAEKLKVYEAQLATVDAAIAQDPSNDEWTRLKADLLEVIALTKQLCEASEEASESNPAAAINTNLKSYTVGEKCQAVFEMDGQWYNAKVVALAEDGYFVTYLGYGNTAQVDFAEVRPYVRPDTSGWNRSAEIHAMVASEQRWYPARLVSVEPTSARVRFHGEADIVEVELDHVRLAPSAAASSSAQPAAGASASGSAQADAQAKRLPRGLEVLPDDSTEDAARKKRKLNMFKRQEKKEREEKHGDERRSSWQVRDLAGSKAL